MNTALNSDTLPLTEDEKTEVSALFEERADHLEIDNLKDTTVLAAGAEAWLEAVLVRGAKLIVGPRGCGKTHLMRYAWLKCLEEDAQPMCVYTSFNRYYRLEPLLTARQDAIRLFDAWVVANCYLGVMECTEALTKRTQGQRDATEVTGLTRAHLLDLITRLERGGTLTDSHENLIDSISVDSLKEAVIAALEIFGRPRAVLLLDDAALTLTPEYMEHFFNVFRTLKAIRISPKASVYPGTTEYGASFHVAHEAEEVEVWRAVEDNYYMPFMLGIAQKRFNDLSDIPLELQQLLAFAAFGVPRAFLSLVRAYRRLISANQNANPQQAFNVVIDEFNRAKLTEYRSLALKVPRLKKIIEVGEGLFRKTTAVLAEENVALQDRGTKQLHIGITSESLGGPYVTRMLSILVEAGMLYGHTSVSHGKGRTYDRFTPHVAALIGERAFSGGSRGFSPKAIVEFLGRPLEKHPLRRSLNTLLPSESIENLGLDLPPCEQCGTARIEGAKFCHHCGAALADVSTYRECMNALLVSVPGLTEWQRERLAASERIPTTVGEFLALQDRGTALRSINWIGHKRATGIIEVVEAFVDEFLS